MINGIIFDLGHTLLYLSQDAEELARAGAEAMAAWYLKKKHIKLDSAALVETFLAERAQARVRAAETLTEITAQQSLSRTLTAIGAPPVALAPAMLEAAVKVFFEPEQAAWRRYPEAIEVLKALKTEGYCLGVYSNATDDPLIQRLINQNGLRPYLSITFSSAGWGWCKPRPEPFQLIARRWALPPAQVVVIGDTLNTDILGAHNAGMPGILVTMNESPANKAHRHIQPTATAGRLDLLPALIAQL